ncbi:MAG: hypothetical protein EBZ59_09060 [Planctomycetia bacterium]|nr:hypothetical protein [Planctomycetia bacterium]
MRARLRMQGLAGSLGTGITLAVRGAAADGKPLGGPAIAARTFYLADFSAEDAWQEFDVTFDHHPLRPPPLVMHLPGTPSRVVVEVSIPVNRPRESTAGPATRGHSTPFASLRRLLVDTIGIERLPEPDVCLRDVRARKAWLRPGERQSFEVDLHNRTGQPRSGEVRLSIESGLGAVAPLPAVPFTLADGDYRRLAVDWDVPADHPLWGQTAIAEAVVDGRVAGSWRTWFAVHPRNTAVMIPYMDRYAAEEGVRFQHPTASKPNVANHFEYWAPTPFDAAGLVPDDLDRPFLSGNSGKVESLAKQRRIVDELRERGIAAAFYLEGHGTGEKAWQTYWDHPEWCAASEGQSDQFVLRRREVEPLAVRHFLAEEARVKRARGEPLSADELALPKDPPGAFPMIPHLGFVTVNCLMKPVLDSIIDGHHRLMDRVPYTTCRWDNARPLACFGVDALGHALGKSPDDLVRQEVANVERYLAEVRERHPHFEVGFNYGHSALLGRRDDPFDFGAARKVIDDDPLAKAILADGGYILEEAWGHSFEVWNDYKVNCRNYLRACRAGSAAYKHAGGHHGHMFRDMGVSYTPDDVYQQLFSLLGGAHLCACNYGPLPETMVDLGVYACRFAEFFWDPALRQLEAIGEKVAVESEAELWADEAGFEKDAADGGRLYVLPLINPPVTEAWLKNRYGLLPEPVLQPVAVTVRVPDGFTGVKGVHELAASPWPEVRRLEFETDGSEVRFEVPQVVTFTVAVVEFTK